MTLSQVHPSAPSRLMSAARGAARAAMKLAASATISLVPVADRPDLLASPAIWLAFALLAGTFLTQPHEEGMAPRSASERASLLLITLGSVGLVMAGVLELRLSGRSPSVVFGLVAGGSVAAAGFALRLWAIRSLGRFFTSSLEVARDQRVVDTGPYRFVRHPAFLGVLLSGLGLALALQSLAALATCLLVLLPAYLYRIRHEEARLAASLGEPYREYQARTSMLIPFVL